MFVKVGMIFKGLRSSIYRTLSTRGAMIWVLVSYGAPWSSLDVYNDNRPRPFRFFWKSDDATCLRKHHDASSSHARDFLSFDR